MSGRSTPATGPRILVPVELLYWDGGVITAFIRAVEATEVELFDGRRRYGDLGEAGEGDESGAVTTAPQGKCATGCDSAGAPHVRRQDRFQDFERCGIVKDTEGDVPEGAASIAGGSPACPAAAVAANVTTSVSPGGPLNPKESDAGGTALFRGGPFCLNASDASGTTAAGTPLSPRASDAGGIAVQVPTDGPFSPKESDVSGTAARFPGGGAVECCSHAPGVPPARGILRSHLGDMACGEPVAAGAVPAATASSAAPQKESWAELFDQEFGR